MVNKMISHKAGDIVWVSFSPEYVKKYGIQVVEQCEIKTVFESKLSDDTILVIDVIPIHCDSKIISTVSTRCYLEKSDAISHSRGELEALIFFAKRKLENLESLESDLNYI
jgi:hypothetical protein